MTFVVVMALRNQPEAFASDLGDDQSRYLYNKNFCTSIMGIYNIPHPVTDVVCRPCYKCAYDNIL